MRKVGFVLAAVITLLSGGCAHQHVSDFAVPPPGVRVRQAGAEASALMVSVADRRTDKTIVGTARAVPGDGQVWTIALRQPLELAVSDAVAAEFVSRGYRMGTGQASLLVDIAEARSDMTFMLFRTRVVGSVLLEAKVLDPNGRQMYEKRFRQAINVENKVAIGDWNEGNVEVAKAIGELIREMADDPALAGAILRARSG
jgi:uncharacterized lipoprotein YajG